MNCSFIYRSKGSCSYAEASQKLGSVDEMVTAGRMMDIAVEKKNQSDELKNYFSFLISTFSAVLSTLFFYPNFFSHYLYQHRNLLGFIGFYILVYYYY